MGRIVKRWPCTTRDRGFTMLELLAVVAVGGVALAATGSLVVSQIRVTRTLHSSGQAQQDLSRLHRFLLAETHEACSFQLGSTSPTNCGGTCVTSGFNELRLLVPITTSVNADPSNAANLRTIIYRLSNNQLLRTGPRILSNGLLDTTTTNDQTDALVIDNVNTFTPTLSADCNIATISVRLNVQGTSSTLPTSGRNPEQFILKAGTRIFN